MNTTSYKIWDIPGGIHPPENKIISTQRSITKAILPHHLILPLSQHIGNSSIPVVCEGEYVLKGQLIAKGDGFISVPLHAPSSGRVVSIGLQPYPHVSNMQEQAIVIETDGQEQWINLTAYPNYKELDAFTLIQHIRQAGINGLGGAGFPTAVKVSAKLKREIHTLIVNGSECEPYITADDLLMQEYAYELISGIQILQHITQAKQILIGIEDNKPDAIKAVRIAVGDKPFKVISIPTKYPSGGARQLIKILTGIEVVSGKPSVNMGILCQNVGTIVAIHNAIMHGKPLISRITTVTGETLKEPGNMEVLIGTPINEILRQAGVDYKRMHQLVIGGPMMGFIIKDLKAPVIKTTNCLLVPAVTEFSPAPAPLPCIRCGACADACPVNLLPQQLYFFSQGKAYEQLKKHHLFDCIECSLCSYVCPSDLPLVQYYQASKADIKEAENKQQKADQAKNRFELRQKRLKLAEEQKIADRKVRAEKAALHKKEIASSDTIINDETKQLDQIKKLKIASSIAQVALKKAEKQFASHNTIELKNQIEVLTQTYKSAVEALKQATKTHTDTTEKAVSSKKDDLLKKAKINFAVKRAEVRKAELEKSTSQSTKAELQKELEAAKQDLLQAELHTTQVEPKLTLKSKEPLLDTKTKELKTEIAFIQAEIKRLQRNDTKEKNHLLASATARLAAAEQQLLTHKDFTHK
ncbi:UNVERIFIED_CONTAM: hypothetical protein GTU68_062067 [Idotea baltica]|nr:hypothetical protein [Idotea baltica]